MCHDQMETATQTTLAGMLQMHCLRAARRGSFVFLCRKEGGPSHRAVGALQRAAFPQQPRAALRPRSHALRSGTGSVFTCVPTAGLKARRVPHLLQCPRPAGASHLHAPAYSCLEACVLDFSPGASAHACMPSNADVSLAAAAGSSSARSRAAPSDVLSRRNSCAWVRVPSSPDRAARC